METPPWALSGGSATYPAEQTRRAMFAWAARTAANDPGIISGGLLSGTDMQLSAAASGLVVYISTGECIIGGTEGGVQGGYYARNASQSSVTLATANGTNPRIDAVVGMVGDGGYTLPSGATSGAVTLVGVTGTPTAGATLSNLSGAPATPASSLLLGYGLVPANATSLTSADIKNVAAETRYQNLPDALGRAPFLQFGANVHSTTYSATLTWPASSSTSNELTIDQSGWGQMYGIFGGGNVIASGSYYDMGVVAVVSAGSGSLTIQGKTSGGGSPGADATMDVWGIIAG